MPRPPLLPGVDSDVCPPPVRCDARAAVRRARRRAVLRVVLEVLLVGSVDWLFLTWPDARLPLSTRQTTQQLLLAINALLVADLWLMRSLPRWSARRVAATWSRDERERFTRSRSRVATAR